VPQPGAVDRYLTARPARYDESAGIAERAFKFDFDMRPAVVSDLGLQTVPAQRVDGVFEEGIHPRLPRDQCAALVRATPAIASAAPTIAQWY
jgi:hypothetical protein